MGHQMHMFPPQWPWSQPAQPRAERAPKPKKIKKPKLLDMFDETLTELEQAKRFHEAYGAYIKAIEEGGIKKDKEKKEKDKPKKRDGFNIPETLLLIIVLSPFMALIYKYIGRLLGL